MSVIADVQIQLFDIHNPQCGYTVIIRDIHGAILADIIRDPVTGKDLLTLKDALRIVRMFSK